MYVPLFAYCHLFSKSSKGLQTPRISVSGDGHLLWVAPVQPLTQHVWLWGIAWVPCLSLPPAVSEAQDSSCLHGNLHPRQFPHSLQQSLCPIGLSDLGAGRDSSLWAPVPLHRPWAVQTAAWDTCQHWDPWCKVRPRQSTAPVGSHCARGWGWQDHTECSRIFHCISLCRVLPQGNQLLSFWRSCCFNTATSKLVVLKRMLT